MVRYFTLYFLLFCGVFTGYAQLSNFTLTVTVTDETCFGNGSLAFSVSGTQPGATVIYEIYKLPNTTTPIASSTGNPVTGLNSGAYSVIATQSLGGNSGSQTVEAIIADLTDPLTFSTQSKMICPDNGTITVNILTGMATTYQIISGPNGFSAPPQTSNVFTGLQEGLYLVGVQDAGPCENFITQNSQVVHTPLAPLVIIKGQELPDFSSCEDGKTVNVGPVIYTLGALPPYIDPNNYPLTVTYTTYPPDGSAPVVQTKVVNLGESWSENIPQYDSDAYYYQLTVTNVCGDTYSNTFLLDLRIYVSADYFLGGDCHTMIINVARFIGDYTIEFDSHPVGFDPELYNVEHPGPFTIPFVFYGADPTGEFILGDYVITITDACGRTVTSPFSIQPPPFDSALGFIVTPPSPPECECKGFIDIAHAYGLESVIVLDAPDEYMDYLTANGLSLPHDISEFIGESPLNFMLKAPAYGCDEYTILITDVCGNEITLTNTMEPWDFDGDFLAEIHAPGCDGFGTIRIESLFDEKIIGKMESVYIVDAPDEFYTLFGATIGEEYDATEYAYPIATASEEENYVWFFSMTELPAGEYELSFQFGCKFISVNYIIETYQQTTTIQLEEMCGAFNMSFDHTANHTTYFEPLIPTLYWLERYNETTEEWKDIPGYSPFLLQPNQMNYNIHHLGNFRIVKRYTVWNPGNIIPPEGSFTFCVEPIYEFEFTGNPRINDVAYFPCPNGGSELFVDASGAAPLLYEIIEKDGQPFYINNGESNLFANLEQGVYSFRVTDSCENVVNGTYSVSQPFDFTITATPFCNDQQGFLSTNYFPFLEYQWWKEDNPNEIVSTSYQLIFDSFDINQDYGTYYLSISYPENPNSCINQTLTYEIKLTPPKAGNDQEAIYCSLSSEEHIDLFTFFTSEYENFGVWEDLSQTGELQNNILAVGNLPVGTYEFGYTVNACEGTSVSVITLILLGIPDSPVVTGTDILCEGSDIELSVENPNPYYTYTWTYPNGAVHTGETVLITGIGAGINTYVVTASILNFFNEENGCVASTSIDLEADYCEIPKGISPNEDGQNDNFDLSDFDVRNLKIFNRYGRMVYEAKNGYTNEWHGQSTVNNKMLPAATYYYVVTFGNGNIKTGWVYLTRGK